MDIETIEFDSIQRTRVVFGAGVIHRLGELVRELGGSRVLLVTDPGLTHAGHPQKAERILRAAGLELALFDRVEENPTTDCIDACVETARAFNVDCIAGLGGGSSLDTAKGCNFVLTNGGRMHDYWGYGKAAKPMLPLIAIPTTAGTGSECQSFALISDAQTHVKMACGDPKAAPRIALLDPELTLTQPRSVTANTGIDAIAHAVETAVTRKRNAVSQLYSREAFRLLQANFSRVLADPGDLPARSAMLLGAAWAGVAIENSMLGGAHALANPLTARHGVVHGQAVGMMLPHVVRYNAQDPISRRLYAELAGCAGLAAPGDDEGDASEALASRLEELLDAAGMPRALAELNVPEDGVAALAQDAARQWTANFNPRELTPGDFESMYAGAMRCGRAPAGS
ncbi:MAG: iron-containing alcohol dehydrogenase [bacterium]|nr:iron-containing alcohol dehydrogenase [bacterium]